MSKRNILKFLIILFIVNTQFLSYSQSIDSLKTTNLDSVIVTSYKSKSFRESSLNITSLKIDSLSRFGNFNLADLIAKTPGVTMLSTGIAISKPVIRGLYGNRVLLLISGLKFDNQQWQEEHGLGLSDVGISKVELIKGPMSVLYGTEAIGGIINVIEEEKPRLNMKETDFSSKFNSNTLGGSFQYGYKGNKGNKWYRIRAGIENNADYADGRNNRVLNSRFDGIQLKSTYGFQKKNWKSVYNYMGTFNRYGFIFNDIYSFVSPDNRWSRRLNENPDHMVLLNIISSENTFQLNSLSKLNLNVGVQSNKRMENEGGGAISLNMHLLTIQYLLKWERIINENNKLIISSLGSFENNTNIGSRKIVPDANILEGNISTYLETSYRKRLILENGIGLGDKWIKTLLTPTVNSKEKDIKPFTKQSIYYNLFSGFTFFPSNKINVKANIATGVRVPNLAELSSNGLHEGIFTYEIGDPNLKNEQNLAFNILANFKSQKLEFTVSPFCNYFYNYVYLTPTNESWYGFPVYRYKQQNVKQYGGEVYLIYKPSNKVYTSITYAGMISQLADGNYTPYIPAQKITPSINYTLNSVKHKMPIQLFSNADFCFQQTKTAPFEKATPHYWLLNMGASTSYETEKVSYVFTISGNNILNVAYYDHLSRFKNYGLLNIGRNIAINLRLKFKNQINSLNNNK